MNAIDASRAVEPPRVAVASLRLDALLATRWVDAMLAYWGHAIELGLVDQAAGLDVLDLQPGAGEAFQLLIPRLWREVQRRWPGVALIRWWAVAEEAADIEGWRRQPELRLLMEGGDFIALPWRIDMTRAPRAVPEGQRWPPANPLVVLAHDRFRRTSQQLMAVHYGQFLEGDLKSFAAEGQGVMDSWRPARAGVALLKPGRLARRYGEVMNSAPICVPSGALHCVDVLKAGLPAGWLMLAAARGTASRRRLQTLGFEGVRAWFNADGLLPVNFELIAQHVESAGGAAWSREAVDGQVVFAGVVHAQHAAALLRASAGSMRDGRATDGPALQQAMRTLAMTGRAPAILALLGSARGDPAVFHAACPALHVQWLLEDDADRPRWRDALHRTWKMCLPGATERALLRDLALCAMAVGDWALAKRIWHRCQSAHGEDAQDGLQLARCEEQTGELEEAVFLVAASLHQGLDDPPLASSAEAWLDALRGRMGAAWRLHDAVSDVALEPLALAHAPALAHQYRDSQIAVMTGLPPLASRHVAQKWIADRLVDPTRREMAALHRDLGFIGHVGLHVSADVGFFYFWIGVDAQGHGHAGTLGRRLCELARRNGLRMLVTSAYADNVRSLMALTRIGFRRVEIGLKPKDNDTRVFLWLALGDVVVDDPAAEVVAFHERENLMGQFVESDASAAAGETVTANASANSNPNVNANANANATPTATATATATASEPRP